MNFWTEYEGRTIAGSFTLSKLLRSEGRNGFFATSTGKGDSAVIRLTEAHFDEEELLTRWRHVAAVHQTNLIEIERVGQTTFDGVALTYALMEPNDANLGDVLKERPLTTAETTQVAKSVLAALRALHDNGLVHEHIEPANVLAVGDVVKLRSDCVRECIADVEFNTEEGRAELRRRDTHAFALLLLQCLTLERDWKPGISLPDPFRRIIPNALEDTWGLEQIAAVLDPATAAPRPVAPLAAAPAPVGNGTIPAPARPLIPPGVLQHRAASALHSSPGMMPGAALHTAPGIAEDLPAQPSLRTRRQEAVAIAEPSGLSRLSESSGLSMNHIWLICVASAVLLASLAWYLFAGRPAKPAAGVPVAAIAAPAPEAAAQVAAPETRHEAAQSIPRPAASAPGWYVVAFTFNREDQAQIKADRLNARHEGLHAQVFSPGGHAPFLVSLGGAMSQSEAEAVWRHARRDGLPRDTFVRRYGRS